MRIRVTAINHWSQEEVEIAITSAQGVAVEHRPLQTMRLYDVATRRALLAFDRDIGAWREASKMESTDPQDIYTTFFIQPIEG